MVEAKLLMFRIPGIPYQHFFGVIDKGNAINFRGSMWVSNRLDRPQVCYAASEVTARSNKPLIQTDRYQVCRTNQITQSHSLSIFQANYVAVPVCAQKRGSEDESRAVISGLYAKLTFTRVSPASTPPPHPQYGYKDRPSQ
jgi:hypothetical protein